MLRQAWVGVLCAAVFVPGVARAQVRITGLTPDRPRAGAEVVVSVASPGPVRVCLTPMVGHARCVDAVSGQARFVAPYLGRWTVSAESGAERTSRAVRILPRGESVVVLAAGDSLVRNFGWGLRRLFPRPRVFHTEVAQGRGLTKPDGFVWAGHARETVERWKPDIVVVFLGGNEGFPIGPVECCGADWVSLFAGKQREVMRAYQDEGRARVYWTNLPAPGPSRPGHRTTWAAENLALTSAVSADDARLFDASALLTPGFRFRRFLPWHSTSRKARDDDDIHLTRAGGLIAAEALIAQLRADQVIGER